MGVRFLTSSGVGPPKNKKYPSQIPFKRKMKDDIIIHSVMFLTFMALIAQGHGSKDGDVKKDEHGWGGGYKSHGGYGGGYGGYKSGYGGGYGGYGRHKFGGYGGYKTGYGGGYGGYGGSHGKHDLEDEEKDQATKNTEGYEVPEFDHSYVDNYIHKVHDYVDAGDHYKTNNLQVKVNWNLQDGKPEYLKSQYGIYPQLQPKYGYGGYYGRGY